MKKTMSEAQRERIIQYAYGMSSALGGAKGPKPKTKTGKLARQRGRKQTIRHIKKYGMPRHVR